MADPIDIAAARAAWEALEAGCAGLLASQCKGHRPYTACPMDCADVANALDPEFAIAQPLVTAAIAEVDKLRAELAEAHEALTAARSDVTERYFVTFLLDGRRHLLGPRHWNEAVGLQAEAMSIDGAGDIRIESVEEVLHG